LKFFSDHAELLSVLALALIATMPEDPPHSLGEIPGWLYQWTQRGLKTFVSFRAPQDRTPTSKP
jgi:hypothetical protein